MAAACQKKVAASVHDSYDACDFCYAAQTLTNTKSMAKKVAIRRMRWTPTMAMSSTLLASSWITQWPRGSSMESENGGPGPGASRHFNFYGLIESGVGSFFLLLFLLLFTCSDSSACPGLAVWRCGLVRSGAGSG